MSERVRIFMKNNFVFRGEVLSKDEKFIEVLDEKTQKPRFISLDQISEMEVLER